MVIEEAFRDFNRPEDDYFTIENLRNLVSQEIDKNNFQLILETYKLEKENNEFNGYWDPDEIEKYGRIKR